MFVVFSQRGFRIRRAGCDVASWTGSRWTVSAPLTLSPSATLWLSASHSIARQTREPRPPSEARLLWTGRADKRQQPLPAGLETDTPSGLGRGRVAVGSAPSSAPRTRHHFPGDASGNLRRSTWSAGGSPGTSKALPTALEKSQVLKRGRTAHTTAPERGRQERGRGLSFSFGCTTRSPHS